MKRKVLSVVHSGVRCRIFALASVFVIAVPTYVTATAPTPQYGYCYARTADGKKVYVSAVFEMPMEDIRAGSCVILAEFNKALAQKYGSPADPSEARSAGCPVVWNVSKTDAEKNRQAIVTDAHQQNTQLFDTGWTFMRTAQTPPAGPPAGGRR